VKNAFKANFFNELSYYLPLKLQKRNGLKEENDEKNGFRGINGN
jgi:hypothetical protein